MASDLSLDFLKYHQTQSLFLPKERILVALSGGKDSVCLFSLLLQHSKALDITFACCHVHHGIRGAEADRDLAFCKKLCEANRVEFYEERLDVPSYCKKEKVGLEEGARILRYKSLQRIAEQYSYDKIATAHTASDQAETLLFRIARGTGLSGLCGIQKQRGNLIRPLLSFSSKEVTEYLEAENIPFISDSSNDDVVFKRNFIRRHAIPTLQEIHPEAELALNRLSELAAQQMEFLDYLCRKTEAEHGFCFSTGRAPLSLLQALALQAEAKPLLHRALSKMTGNKFSIDYERFSSFIPLLKEPISGKIFQIGGGFQFRFSNNLLIFEANDSDRRCIEYKVELSIGENPLTMIEKSLVLSEKKIGPAENINRKHLIIHLDSDKIQGTVFARPPESGDTVFANGMSRSVKKILHSKDFQNMDRKLIPLVCDAEGIIWIPGFGLADRVRPESALSHVSMELKSISEPEG